MFDVRQNGPLSSAQQFRLHLAAIAQRCKSPADYAGVNPSIVQSIRSLLYTHLFAAAQVDGLPLQSENPFSRATEDLGSLQSWSLAHSQLEATRGSFSQNSLPCTHLFRQGESVYCCRDCGVEDAAFLCSQCFRSDQHQGHDVLYQVHAGGALVCSCNDPDVWLASKTFRCTRHASKPLEASLSSAGSESLPAISQTIQTALDFCLETWASTPSSDADVDSQLAAQASTGPYCVVVWNDEKHGFNAVLDQLARALPTMPSQSALDCVIRIDAVGRDVVLLSSSQAVLSHVARTISNIDLAVTIRSAETTLWETASSVMMDWLNDLTEVWTRWEDEARRPFLEIVARLLMSPQGEHRFAKLATSDSRTWKHVRLAIRQLLVRAFSLGSSIRMQFAESFMHLYPTIIDTYLFADREPEYSIVQLSMQLFCIPSVARHLISHHNAFAICICILFSFFTEQTDSSGKHLRLPPNFNLTNITPDGSSFKHKRYLYLFADLRRLLATEGCKADVAENHSLLALFVTFADLFTSMNPIVHASGVHVEFETDTWVTAFNMTMHLAKACRTVAECFSQSASPAVARDGMSLILKKYKPRNLQIVSFASQSYWCVCSDIEADAVSFHHPLTWLLAETSKNLPAILSAGNVADLNFGQASLTAPEPAGQDSVAAHETVEFASFLTIIEDALITCALVAQIRSGLWVRNGFSVRAQQLHYREYSLRENTFDQDVYLLQLGLLKAPAHMLVAILHRYKLVQIMDSIDMDDVQYDLSQRQSMLEEFLLLLTNLLGEPSNLDCWSIDRRVRRDIVHGLALGSCSHTDLVKRVADLTADYFGFDRILSEVSTFRQPQGPLDHGVYHLRPEFVHEVDAYFFRYSRNQRDEINTLLRQSASFANEEDWFRHSSSFSTSSWLSRSLYTVFGTTTFCTLITRVFQSQIVWGCAEPLLDLALHILSMALVICDNDGIPFANGWQRAASQDVLGYLDTLRLTFSESSTLRKKIDFCRKLLFRSETPVVDPITQLSLPEAVISESNEVLMKKLAAQSRQTALLAQFAKAQQTFVDNHPSDFDDEDNQDISDDDADQVMDERPNTVCVGSCIVCQENLDHRQIFGLLILIQASTVLQSVTDLEALFTARMPVGPSSEDLGGPSQRDRRNRPGLYASTCGHMMHLTCFNTYCQSVEARHSAQPTRNHPEDLGRREFICPLCKSLGNVLLPHPGNKSPADSAPETSIEALETWASLISDHHITDKSISQAFTHSEGGRIRSLQINQTSIGLDCGSPGLDAVNASMVKRLPQVMWPLSVEAHRDDITNIETHYAYLPEELVAYTISVLEVQGREQSDYGKLDQLDRSHLVIRSLLQSVRELLGGKEGRFDLQDVAHSLCKRLVRRAPGPNIWSSPILLRQPLALLVELLALFNEPSQYRYCATYAFYLQIMQIVLSLHTTNLAAAMSTVGCAASDGSKEDVESECLGQLVIQLLQPHRHQPEVALVVQHEPRKIGKLILFLANPFVRRAVMLREALFESEGPRLSYQTDTSVSHVLPLLQEAQIGLPSDVIAAAQSKSGASFGSRLSYWLETYFAAKVSLNFELESPVIHFLVGLPTSFDILVDRAARHVCSRCGTVPTDPALCLLCGQIVCNQSFCCMDRDMESEPEHGECNMHMLSCGGSSGMFLLIRRCAVILLYANNGCTASSPYLDIHGEVDMGNRRHRRQFLQVKRYEELRRIWIQQSIPTAVARRLEAGVDNGGWTTF